MNRFFLIILFYSILVFPQDKTFIEKDISINPYVDGTLIVPENSKSPILAIIIPGSGPTNRDGNQNFMKNNSLKKLALALANYDIATFRYDKRVVKQIRDGNIDKNISFDDFVNDAKSVVKYFTGQNQFDKIYLIGHSQGSLVAMLAANENVDGLVSLAGAGTPIDEVILEQLGKTAPMFVEDCKRVFDTLKIGKTTDNFPVALTSIFNLEVQPFMMSWMKYDPRKVIKELDKPILIINGTKDLQFTEGEAKLLWDANPNSELVIIDRMNHILVPIEGDDLENSKSYNETSRKISQELIITIVDFLKKQS